GIGAALTALRKVPEPGSIEGLRHASVGIAAPFSKHRKPPMLVRVGLVSLWDDDAALDRFQAQHPLAKRLGDGFVVRLEPLRAYGTWPGLPADVPSGRSVDHDGPAVVLTLARLRLTQAVRFFRTSGKAEAKVAAAPGLIWATALARPPFLATCSLWDDTRSLSTYAYGHSDPRHSDAIAAQAKRDFFHESAFIRFRPYGVHGSLDGRNPLREQALSV
ncbi:MAG: spheroidene monooxygenase, partial [Acidimicrobiales bacterium]